VLLKSLLAWLAILCFAVVNGALREAVLIPSLGKTSGLILSGVLLSCLVALVAYILVRREHGIAGMQGLYIGVLWLCLTLAFEFSFGRYIQHKPWAELLSAYTFKDGNLWLVVLLTTLLAPYFAALFHAKSRRANSDA
jgi:peptidoglycan biosynthesis protein MviN/MurJ (putative lipid II flippase)